MKYTVIAVEAHHSQGDAYRESTYSTFKVLGVVDAESCKGAITAMELKLRGNQEKFSGKVIAVPGVIGKVVEGYTNA